MKKAKRYDSQNRVHCFVATPDNHKFLAKAKGACASKSAVINRGIELLKKKGRKHLCLTP